ncbi:hypothetical protein [Botrimarina mediterranea]|uniref:Uncharacterized protein n=1 Tax=Botrimarina mediterranea TaxID=2528022 RepID=A0A518KC22_9BACT|nr:hypothetical protein [Botrimarina mediterranea]QDV75325.1 hypothetical protein Spa11_35400 [Botrimarina mediterranea]
MNAQHLIRIGGAARGRFYGVGLLVGALSLVATAPAEASIELNFGADSTSSNPTATGASAKVVMSFIDSLLPGEVDLELLISNTTGSPVFGSGATASMLTGFAIDLPIGVSLVANSLMTDLDGDTVAYFDTLLVNASLPPFGSVDFGVADNANFQGGNANGALPAGSSDKVSIKLSGGTAAVLEAAFLSALTDPGDDSYKLTSFVRFQQVNAGEGSDKLTDPTITMTPPPPPTDGEVPEPASLFVWAMVATLGVGSATGCRQRNRA